MSRVAESYYDRLMRQMEREEECKVEPIMIDISELSEEQRCKLLGIACSYGICSECNITERSEK